MKIISLAICLCLVVSAGVNVYAEDVSKLERRIDDCAEILDEVMQMPDKSIPNDLLSKCAGVAVFPYVLKGGFFVGARYGKGIVIAHDPATNEWKAPAFFTIGGGSFGLQFGAQATDLILVIMNKRGLEGLLQDKFTLGGDAEVAAGPLGRTASADTDLLLKAGIFSYSRSKGIFAGVSLEGAVLIPEKDANHAFYGKEVSTEDILLSDKIKPTEASTKLIEGLKKASVK